MKVVVTGAGGHLGRILGAALVEAGMQVRALSHADLDVRDRDAVARALADADVVYHLAAKISLHARDADLMLATQVDGTRNVIAARPGRLVHVASIHAYDPMPLGEAVTEDRPLATHGRHFAYDRSKGLGAELVLGSDLDAVVVSPTAMIAPDDTGPSEIGALIRRLLHRELPGLVRADFDWVDARDVAAMLVRLAQPAPSRAYLLPGHRMSLVELGRTVCRLGGVRPPMMTSPLWLAKATVPFAGAWARITGGEPLYTKASLATLGHYEQVSGARAARELGWSPRPLEGTLKDTVAWWMSQT